jgi:hypothetical protein
MPDKREEEIKTITFGGKKELDPDEEAAYAEKIRKAKQGGIGALKGSTPVGGVERPEIPDLTKKHVHPDAAFASAGLTAEGGVALRPPGSPVLSQATQQQLEAMQQAQAKPQLDEKAVAKAAEDHKEDLLDVFDFMAQDEASRILNNKKRRTDIESRLQPMDFEDLLMKGFVEQTIPIIPGKYEPRFRSLKPGESLFIKSFMAKDETAPNDSYAAEKYSLCQLACALVSMNGKAYQDHRDNKGNPDTELFKLKLKQLLEQSVYIISDLGINYLWFDIRVRKLISPDKLGNG